MGAPVTARIVDLDSNHLVAIPPVRLPKPVLEAQAQARLCAVLQTTIDLPDLLKLFFQEAARALELDGLHYRHGGHDFEFELGQVAGHSSHYHLQTKEDMLGELSLHRLNQPFSEAELRRLDTMMTALVYPIRNGLRYLAAVRASLTDGLTGAGNRINLDNVLAREVEQAHRYQQPLSVLMLDLDHFKTINDVHGHAAGDYVLKMVASTLRASSRCADMTFRFGGEEFVVLLNKTDSAGARVTAERIRHNIASLALHYDGKQIPVSISMGVATLRQGEGRDSLLQRADQALYLAKQNGRAQVISADQLLTQVAS